MHLQCKQGTVLNVTGSYKYTQLIQQLVRSLEIRVKTHTNYKNKRKIIVEIAELNPNQTCMIAVTTLS